MYLKNAKDDSHFLLASRITFPAKVLLIFLLLCLSLALIGCEKGNPNPVEKKDGLVYIPIDNTAFLIPEKTWLKSYANNSTDGSVCCFTLHATIPDVQPWSQERHDEMYRKVGPGKKLRITVNGNKAFLHEHFYEVPSSTMYDQKFIEEPSDQIKQGLRQFRTLYPEIDDKAFRRLEKSFGKKSAKNMKKKEGMVRKDMIYYEKIENNKVKYFIYCDDTNIGLFSGCHLRFLWASSLEVDIYFIRRDMEHIVSMADKVSEKLKEFENAGLVYKSKLGDYK